MTKQRNLKGRIRERMLKTGESFAAARRHVLGPVDGALAKAPEKLIDLEVAEEGGLPPDEFWTEATRQRYLRRAEERWGVRFREISALEPRLLGLEARVNAIWKQLLEEKPRYFRVEDYWYSEDGIKRALSKLVGYYIPTSAGPAPKDPTEVVERDGTVIGNMAWILSPQYQQWRAANQAALKEVGFLATTAAYQPTYDYLLAMFPWRYLWEQAEEGGEDEF